MVLDGQCWYHPDHTIALNAKEFELSAFGDLDLSDGKIGAITFAPSHVVKRISPRQLSGPVWPIPVVPTLLS